MCGKVCEPFVRSHNIRQTSAVASILTLTQLLEEHLACTNWFRSHHHLSVGLRSGLWANPEYQSSFSGIHWFTVLLHLSFWS